MIPKIIHFVYGLQEDFGGKPFSFVHWAAIKSAVKHNPDYKIIFWYSYLPKNYYFDDVKHLLELRKIEPPSHIFGNPLHHVAHKADVVRLQALIELGGFYMDMDTITTKSFDALLNHKFLMAIENAENKKVGLCNAIMGSEPSSSFSIRWMDSYKAFRSLGRDQFWSEHSVVIPGKLAEEHPDEITVLPQKTFFYPDWTAAGLEQLFIEDHSFPEAYAHHLWEGNAWGALSALNENNVASIKNSYTRIINSNLGEEVNELKAKRLAWIKQQLNASIAELNLGSGSKFDILQINCDMYPESGADLIFNLQSDSWPIPDSSASKVILHHVLEHLPGDLSHFFKELYRVSRNGAVVDIRVPHPRHDWFLTDPTHVRPWLPESFFFLDKKKCMDWYFNKNANTPLALYWGIDFEVMQTGLSVDQQLPLRLSQIFGNNGTIDNMLPYVNNIVGEIVVQLRVRKN